jgi:hypothetical protein
MIEQGASPGLKPMIKITFTERVSWPREPFEMKPLVMRPPAGGCIVRFIKWIMML